MTELNHNLRGLALGGIRRFTTLAQERGDCILLTLGEPEFDTPGPIRQACKDALDRGRTHYTENRETWPCARPSPGSSARAGAWTTLQRKFSLPWGHRRPSTPPYRRPQSGG